MKKIIEHGYKYNMETICPNCGCKFSYDWEDVIRENITYNTNNNSTFASYRIICPECGANFQLLNWSFNWSSEPIKFTCSCGKNGCRIKNEED